MSTALENLLKRNDIPKDAKTIIRDEIIALRHNKSTSIKVGNNLFKQDKVEEELENHLVKSEEKYRILFDTIPIGVGYTNREGNILGVNPEMLKITGYSLEEVRKLNSFETYVNPNDGLKLRTLLEKEGKVKNFETRLKRKDGSILQTLVNCIQTKMDANDAYLCTFVDQTSSKETEKAMRESEKKFQKIFEEGPLGMSLLNHMNEYIEVNPALCDLLGYTEDELLTMTFSEITHPDDLENDLKMSKKLFDEEISIHKIKKRYIKKDGSVLNAKLSASVIHDDKGDFLYGVGMIEDYTEQIRIEEEILREKKTAQQYLDVSGVIFVAIDEKQLITLINQKGCSVLGYSETEILGKNWFDTFIPGRMRKEIRAVFQKLMLGEIDSVEYHENPVITRKGEELLIAWHNTVLKDEQGKIIGILCSGLDITEQRRTIESLKESESKYQILVENSLQGIAIIQNEKYQYVNPAFAKTVGYSVEEMLTFSSGDVWDLIHPDDKEILEQRNTDLHNGIHISPVQKFRYIRNDGSIKWVESQITAIQYNSQPAIQIFEMDITEHRISEILLRKQTLELERSNKSLRQFAYATSHDLQEPLRTIASFLQLLQKKYENDLDFEAHTFINYAVDGAVHMKQLIDDLLSYSRLGTKEMSSKPVSLSQIIETSIYNLKIVIEESEAEVISKKLPDIGADESQLILLFQNLIENAIKFRSKEKPLIEITSKVSERHNLIFVKDNGIGIEKQYHERIFQVFKRLHTRSEYPGTGIGLAICKRIVEQYNGKIWVESELGKGATFVIEFPII